MAPLRTDSTPYQERILARAEKYMTRDGWVAPVAAAQLHDELVTEDPELLAAWLRTMGKAMLTRLLRDSTNRQRADARQQASSGRFASAAAAHEAGDSGPLALYTVYHVIRGGTRKRA